MKKERYWFQWDLDWRNKRLIDERLIDERLKKITADAQIKKRKSRYEFTSSFRPLVSDHKLTRINPLMILSC